MIYIGTKFYRYNDKDEVEYFRIIGYQNSEIVQLRDEQTNEVQKISLKDLKSRFIADSYSALILFTHVAKRRRKEDVLVTLYRREEELIPKKQLPYCACRQGITDIHANQLSNGKTYYGACVSVDTIPEGVPFDIMVSCDYVYDKDTQIVATYNDDTLDTILSMIKTKLYDNVLNMLFLEHAQYLSTTMGKIFYNNVIKAENCEGYCRTLKSLLSYNNFMYDFHRGFNIFPMDFDLSGFDEKKLPENYTEILRRLLCKNIDKALVIKYSYDIDLKAIQRNYILVSDKNGGLYIITYTYHGEYHIPVEEIETAENIENLHSKMNSKSVQEAYNHLMFNRTKFL